MAAFVFQSDLLRNGCRLVDNMLLSYISGDIDGITNVIDDNRDLSKLLGLGKRKYTNVMLQRTVSVSQGGFISFF